MLFRGTITVTVKKGIPDPRSEHDLRMLHGENIYGLDFPTVVSVVSGRSIVEVVGAEDRRAAYAQLEEMAQQLLANPVSEQYAIALELYVNWEVLGTEVFELLQHNLRMGREYVESTTRAVAGIIKKFTEVVLEAGAEGVSWEFTDAEKAQEDMKVAVFANLVADDGSSAKVVSAVSKAESALKREIKNVTLVYGQTRHTEFAGHKERIRERREGVLILAERYVWQ